MARPQSPSQSANMKLALYFGVLFAAVSLPAAFTLPAAFAQEDCKAPFVKLQTGCYYFSADQVDNWWEAAESCRAVGGVLLTVSDTQQSEELRQYLLKNKPMSNNYIGGYDQGHEGKWYWESTLAPIDSFFDWFPGMPDGKEVQNCMTLSVKYEFHWDDDYCDNSHGKHDFICQPLAMH